MTRYCSALLDPLALPGDRGAAGVRLVLAIAALYLLTAVLFFHRLGDRELTSSHEARAGQNAAVILETGQWRLPRLLDEQIELQKPPLYYWLVALTALARGAVDAWAIRLPAALSAFGCVLLLFALLWRQGRPGAGFIAGCILATCAHFTWLARVGRIDMPLTFAVTAALACFHLGRDSWTWRAVGCVALALGILLKGPIAAVLVAAVALAMMVVDADDRRPGTLLRSVAKRIGNPSFLGGAGLVLLIAAPWFVWANQQTGGRLWDVFVIRHNVERGFGSDTLAAHPWWYYGARIWVDALPWSLALPAAAVLVWRGRWWRDDPICRLGLVWFVAMVVVLSCVRFKRADYLLPAIPGLALFLAAAGERWWNRARPRWGLPVFAATVLATVAFWSTWVNAQDENWPYRAAAERIRAHAGRDTPVIFFRAEVHPLAFHLRRPMGTILEWENLDIWAYEPRDVYFVMPSDCAREWPEHLQRGQLAPVFGLGDLLDAKRDRDLVVMRNVVRQGSAPARDFKTSGMRFAAR
ncbi:MAG: glycosyltransferase family 39 protein [Gemmataceae bacterium]|nr:glycosyltransferase family 39 protein [Gemmataceae bacterium]